MSGYRFCRTDDIPLLVNAYNRCYTPHFDEPPMTVADFKRDVRELNVWSSSCMVALADDEPIAVLISGKTETESLIHRIGVAPGHQGAGHGHHLLDSLAKKLAILGPPRLLAEIPAGWSRVRRFFEAAGYREENRHVDFVLDEPAAPESAANGAIAPIGWDDVVQADAFPENGRRSWERSRPTLANRKDQIGGLAMVSDRIEAYVLHRRSEREGTRDIVALGHTGGDSGEALLGLVVRAFGASGSGSVRVPRVSEEEIAHSTLEAWGFRRGQEYVGYAATARKDES